MSNKSKGALSNREISKWLRKIGADAVSIDNDGRPINRYEKLAQILWDKSLGAAVYDPKTGETKQPVPEQWAIQTVLERIEGKVPTFEEDTGQFHKVGARVDELMKARINSLIEAAQRTSADPNTIFGSPESDSDDEQ
jgi:hypothetical protein